MKKFEVQSIEILTDYNEAFEYISNPKNLPEWTLAFHSVSGGTAVLRTPRGSIDVELDVSAVREQGTIDWLMRFPDGSEAKAHSRLVNVGKGAQAYVFILMQPPVPLEELEGLLEQQSEALKEELKRLRHILEVRR